ncbi:exodeoxyribonuclease VII small subunit [Staphylococcus chromogenes]|uniref:exodeoxyribonuclease VII small subunit n=1 Tax=Staphylococcus chromogenes TaxID=46126 RepID=UPI000D1A777D|nr:exodeoxyribonuclease VII small subunit [Staphylococcus chromogenes]MCE4965849.1 exodeoxyribonuclease VII small subunit [Staphylococcus chromogenes]MDT0692412.1 exodeoxyribonuclease VII small subunit [Staphylococcus chromogenes]MDT0699986.1 exodeoxyribonuclease VII small subunit [Staphylococcus chromogenes]MDU0450580.1 exodeoxyribonuclease VII small subunit [Staphylococcus chromogenes]PTF69008.1 exodeoxyribonuclease VII small subunit [Staphylococcus chromogenes]
MATENKNFEEMMKELETIVNKLDNDSISLEESMELYQKGMTLSKSCEKTLKEAEEKVAKLMENEAVSNDESEVE